MVRALLCVVCLLLSQLAHAAACGEGELPYAMNSYFGFQLQGATGEAACSAIVGHVYEGGTWTQSSYEGNACLAIGHPNSANDGQVGEVTQVCGASEEEPPPTGAVICNGACTVTHVVTINNPMFNLTPQEGGEIAVAIAAIWAIAWAFRMLIRALNVDSASSTSTEKE